jgi:hypothetical protein
MKNNKVFEILRTFSKEEFREFGKFISSPFFARGRNVIPLYRYLRKYYPAFDSPKMTHEEAFSKIFPGRKFSLQAVRNHLTVLQKMSEEYLFQVNIKREKPDYYIHLGDELQYRRVFGLADKILNKGISAVSARGADSNYFFQNYLLENNRDQLLQRKIENEKRDDGINSMSSHFLGYFISIANTIFETIHIQSYNLNRPVISNPLYIFIRDFVKLDEYTNYLKQEQSVSSEIIEIYLLLIKLCLRPEDEEAYNGLRLILRKNFGVLSRWQVSNIYTSLERIAAILEAKDRKYSGLLFDIYKEEVKYNLYSFTEDGPMQPSFFTGAVIQAALQGEYSWAYNFIKEYKNRVLPEYRESRHKHALAILAFEQKDFDEALKLISRIKYEAFAFRYYLKSLQLKIYYELNMYEEALSLIDTFRHFLSSTKSLPQFRKDRYLGFIRYTALLLRAKEKEQELNLPGLKSEIENENMLVEKKWLMEKAEAQIG